MLIIPTLIYSFMFLIAPSSSTFCSVLYWDVCRTSSTICRLILRILTCMHTRIGPSFGREISSSLRALMFIFTCFHIESKYFRKKQHMVCSTTNILLIMLVNLEARWNPFRPFLQVQMKTNRMNFKKNTLQVKHIAIILGAQRNLLKELCNNL